ncbi:hypothetical protein LTR35_007382 [Friedmanniomyces endolithicus]|uniref:Zn(2)-C6 fungal-type domain-containing protein n=2 Tax=Friedmanniomyces endolithicus TaxID=329885 RepID=A0AAN6FTB6_9PEZI|nr:hypothetical protein LTR35_007382 [Friedmanniomyces endolithicus]KAK0297307.1 hypothetical protein LTS00_004028 [Friedmanniomyces endolithicus]KAK0322954.1 hypothetical protein LTR82_005882 [Friedmanniomyces endolithicus]KAK1008339.1 hypothetical protein LTR54_006132 [Friedmanniomyces endolithicus]
MLPAGTPASGHADQTFHFINNEPNHKQNLSGRVSAACVNCRRKKIRCTGEADCRQCREKGLICEGPPSRRRPKREIESTGPWAQVEGPTRSVSSSSTGNNVTDPASGATSFIIDTSHASRRRESQVSLDPSTPASPRGLLETEVTGPGRSIRPLPARRTLQHILPAWERREQGLSPSPAALQERPPSVSTQRFAHGSAPTMSSPTTNSASQWSPGSQSPPLSTAKAARTVSRPTAQEQAPLSAAPPSSYSMEYASQQDSDISWSNNRHLHRSPDRLIHDAEELEDQATSLRQLALRRRSLDFSARTSQQHMPRHQPASQQQTSQRPPSQQEQMMHFALPSNPHESPFSAYPSQPSYASYNFDLSTMYRADGTLDPRLNPNPTDYGLWDVNTPQEHPQPQPSQGLPWQIGTGHSIQATHAQQTYHNHRQLSQDYLMQAPHLPAPPPPPTTADDSALVTTTQGSVSSGSSTDGTGMARMQRAFYAQLAESEDRRGIGTQGRDPRDSGTKFPKR